MRAFAGSAATALATAQTVEEEQLRMSIASADQERGRWARELHDETLQGLGALQVILTTALNQEGSEPLRKRGRTGGRPARDPDRRAAGPDHRAATGGARRHRPRAGIEEPLRAHTRGARRDGGARDRPGCRGGPEAPAASSRRSRARSTGSSRRRSATPPSTRRQRPGNRADHRARRTGIRSRCGTKDVASTRRTHAVASACSACGNGVELTGGIARGRLAAGRGHDAYRQRYPRGMWAPRLASPSTSKGRSRRRHRRAPRARASATRPRRYRRATAAASAA